MNAHAALLVACLCRQFNNDCNVYFVYNGMANKLYISVCMYVCH
jgi:hypothetical protein